MQKDSNKVFKQMQNYGQVCSVRRVPGMCQDSTWKVQKMLEVYRESTGKKLGEYWEFIIKVPEKKQGN